MFNCFGLRNAEPLHDKIGDNLKGINTNCIHKLLQMYSTSGQMMNLLIWLNSTEALPLSSLSTSLKYSWISDAC